MCLTIEISRKDHISANQLELPRGALQSCHKRVIFLIICLESNINDTRKNVSNIAIAQTLIDFPQQNRATTLKKDARSALYPRTSMRINCLCLEEGVMAISFRRVYWKTIDIPDQTIED